MSLHTCEFYIRGGGHSSVESIDCVESGQRVYYRGIASGVTFWACLTTTDDLLSRLQYCICWELGTANQSDRLGNHVIRGRNDLSAKSTCT